MGFLGVYKALYDYAPQSEGELSISEGDILYVLEKSADDDWWKAKKRASADDEDEPVGLVPNNYVEEAPPVGQARALYEYTRQTDEELSFPEDAPLQVYDTSDPDWILVGFEKDYGFAPANYIEMGAATSAPAPATTRKTAPEPEPEIEPEPEPEPLPVPKPPSLPTRASVSFAPVESEEPQSPPLPDRNPPARAPAAPTAPGPAAALAGVMQGRSSTRAATPPPVTIPPRQQYLSEESDGEPSPALPVRPRPQSSMPNEQRRASAHPQRSSSRREYEDEIHPPQSGRIAPGGFHLYNINEMVSIMGKKKKMPTTLGVNLKTGVILIAPEHVSDGPSQEWTAEKMTHYSREGKHVFLELVRPSKSIDFHAGAKDTAEEIVSALGELSGAVRAEGLREVIMAGTGQSAQKKGQVLYDFEAQGEDEVTVSIGDEVMILDDTKSEEWWQVRRLKSGKEGVVPSSYIEIIGTMTSPSTSTSTSGINAGRSTVAQNRLEEARLTKEALKRDQKAAEVGPGMILPERRSSLSVRDNGNTSGQQRNRRENGRSESSRSGSSSKPKPDPTKVRSWTDRSKSFSVEAQFLGLKDGKINLHKLNGVKIAVPVAKMSIEDIEYVERITGASLDEDKPLSEVKRGLPSKNSSNRESASGKVGASIEPAKPDYDWFQFFLSCDVAVGLCERYAQAFAKDSMDESVLPDVDAGVLRNLGLREGDIIKVTRYLDKKYGRDGKKKGVSFSGDDDDGSGGLFSGPGGTLRNNTRKGRPAPAVQTNDNIDPKAFSQKDGGAQDTESSSPAATRPKATGKSGGGFDDDAWDVKPAKQQPEPEAKPAPTPEPAPAAPVQPQRPPTQSMQDLSLLSTPLEPIKVQPTASPTITLPPPQAQPQPQVLPPQTQPQQPGATPAFFTGIPPQQTGLPQASAQPLNLGLGNRQRPTPPQVTGAQGALMPPPPSRPLSAPQSVQPSGFAPPPLQPQMTGIAPPGQSLNDLTQQRMQQQYMGSFQPQPTGQGMMPFNTGVSMPGQFGPGQFMQPQMTGVPQAQSPFADPRPQQFSPIQNQPTGFPGGFQPQQQFPQQTGVNSYLPPALEPQRTGMPSLQPQQTGFGGFGQGFNPSLNNAAAQPQQPPAAPLLPQQTGPPPPVRFGVTDKIVPQPTGRRANLAQATPQNPFGF